MTGMAEVEATQAVLDLAVSLSTERNLNRLLGRIVGTARRLTSSSAGMVYLLDHLKQHLVPEVVVVDGAEVPSETLKSIPLYMGSGRNDTQVAAHAIFNGRIVSLRDVTVYTGFTVDPIPTPLPPPQPESAAQEGGARGLSLLAVPLVGHEEQSVGVLLLLDHARVDGGYPDSLVGTVRAFASLAAVAVDTVKLIADKQHLIQGLAQSNEELEQENRRLRRAVERTAPPASLMVADGAAMRQVMAMADKLRGSDVTVLIEGETGTGKELMAASIHRTSSRASRPFLAQNCAALPEQLLESEFFGHRRGAFTGATENKIGLFEAASGGTLFLDEIGDMPLGLQAKILRVLQEREVRPLGSLESRRVDVRVIAATHRDLRAMIGEGRFREDLFYRLSVFPVRLPPLRNRRDELPALLRHFLGLFSERYRKGIRGFTQEAFEALLAHTYPGNIRELRNLIERAVLLGNPRGLVGLEHLPADLADARKAPAPNTRQNLKELVQTYEARVIAERLNATGGNQTRAAHQLGISRRSLIDKLQRYGIAGTGENRAS